MAVADTLGQKKKFVRIMFQSPDHEDLAAELDPEVVTLLATNVTHDPLVYDTEFVWNDEFQGDTPDYGRDTETGAMRLDASVLSEEDRSSGVAFAELFGSRGVSPEAELVSLRVQPTGDGSATGAYHVSTDTREPPVPMFRSTTVQPANSLDSGGSYSWHSRPPLPDHRPFHTQPHAEVTITRTYFGDNYLPPPGGRSYWKLMPVTDPYYVDVFAAATDEYFAAKELNPNSTPSKLLIAPSNAAAAYILVPSGLAAKVLARIEEARRTRQVETMGSVRLMPLGNTADKGGSVLVTATWLAPRSQPAARAEVYRRDGTLSRSAGRTHTASVYDIPGGTAQPW